MLILALTLATASFEDLDALDRDIAAAAAAMGTQAMPIDRRLRLARCPQGVSVEVADARALAVRCPTIGWRVRVPLVVAQRTTALRAQPAVRRGDPITVRSGGAGFAVETAGVAAEDGVVGGTLRAKLDGGRIIAGVLADGYTLIVGRLKTLETRSLPSAGRDLQEDVQ